MIASGCIVGGPRRIKMNETAPPIRVALRIPGMGMHVLGLRDVVMKRADADDFDIIEVIRYLAHGEKPMEDGHVIADPNGPRFQAFADEGSDVPAGSPMHNPFGRLKLVSMRDIAETN